MKELERLNGVRQYLESELLRNMNARKKLEDDLNIEEQTESVLKEIALWGAGKLDKLVNAALSIIYGDQYSMRRKNKKILVCDGYVETELMDGRGGGVIDVMDIVFRLYSSYKKKGGKLKTLIFDEPGQNLDTKRALLMSKFLDEISEKLGVDIIMTTHRTEFAEGADVIYDVSKNANNETILKKRW